MIKEMFGTQKPIIAMVHMQNFGNLSVLKEDTFSDVKKLQRGGVDALLFENWDSGHIGRHAAPRIKERMMEVMKEAARNTELPVGVNVLPLDYEADFEIAKATGATFVQMDTFVDRVATDYEGNFVMEVEPSDVIVYRKRLGIEDVILMTNIQTKHYVTLPRNKPLETSAIQAIGNGSDALVVTGRVTGEKTPLDKILKAKSIAGCVPVLIGSGLDAGNAAELLAHADGAIVGTSLKHHGVTENPVSEERVKLLMDVVRKLR